MDPLRSLPPRGPLRLRLMLELLDCSQSDLAKAAGVSRATISNLASGKSLKTRPRTLERVASALREHVTTDVLI